MIEINRDLGDETMTEQDKMPTPVAWADLKVGETYWVFCGQGIPNEVTIKAIWNNDLPPYVGIMQPFLKDDRLTYYQDAINVDADDRLMIYASASDAVAAMKACLDQWLEGVGK